MGTQELGSRKLEAVVSSEVKALLGLSPELKAIADNHPGLTGILGSYLDARRTQDPVAALDRTVYTPFRTREFGPDKMESLMMKRTVLLSLLDRELGQLSEDPQDLGISEELKRRRVKADTSLARFADSQKPKHPSRGRTHGFAQMASQGRNSRGRLAH